ncbi:MAG: beta-ketoacyl synthase N-terminal-like domain-containing protein, partial [Acidimicrobiales bacterium]
MSAGDASVDHRGRARLAVTGFGIKTPAGTGVAAFWDTLVAGRSTAAPMTLIDGAVLPVQFACEVRDFDPVAYLGPKESRRADRVAQLAFAAAADAAGDA